MPSPPRYLRLDAPSAVKALEDGQHRSKPHIVRADEPWRRPVGAYNKTLKRGRPRRVKW